MRAMFNLLLGAFCPLSVPLLRIVSPTPAAADLSKSRRCMMPFSSRLVQCPSANASLDVEDLESLLQTRGRVGPLRGIVLVPDVAGIVQLRDHFGNVAVVQFLVIVELVASGNPGRMKMLDPLDVIVNRARHVAVVDRRMVDIVEHSHAR